MKKITIVKIVLDTLMTLVFVLLYDAKIIAGITFHEVAGLAVGGIILIHLLLNTKWIRQVTLNVFSKKILAKTRFGYLIDVLLLLFVGYIIISGIFISEAVFPNLRIGNNGFFKMTHQSVSYAALILIGVHIGLHWDWVMNLFRKIFKISQPNQIRVWVARVVMAAVLVSGIFSIYSTGYLSRLASFGGIFNASQTRGFRPDGGGPGFNRGIPQTDDRISGLDGQHGVQPDDPSSSDRKAQGGEGFGKGRHGGDGRVPPEGFDGRKPGGNVRENSGGMAKGGRAGSNPFSVIYTYSGIISVFAILTYYAGKLFKKKHSAKPSAETVAENPAVEPAAEPAVESAVGETTGQTPENSGAAADERSGGE